MSAQKRLLNALEQRYETYLAQRKRCKKNFSRKTVHNLRVALRRLFSVFELWRTLSPHQHLKKLCRSLKDQLDHLDDLRDTQMMLTEIDEKLDTLPELVFLRDYLRKREKQLLKKAAGNARVFPIRVVNRRIRHIRVAMKKNMNHNDLINRLLVVVDDAFALVSQRARRVDAKKPATIHRVRVAFKKFRYMVEFLAPMLAEYPPKRIENMNQFQTMMGEVQDVQVIRHTLKDFVAAHRACDSPFVRRFYDRRLTALSCACSRKMKQLPAFWRPAPSQSFPWKSRKKGLS